MVPTFRKQKFFNKSFSIDPHYGKDDSFDSQIKDIYKDNMRNIKNFVLLENKDKKF